MITTLAVLAILIPLGAWIGIRTCEANDQIDRTLADFVMSNDFSDELNRAADRWRK